MPYTELLQWMSFFKNRPSGYRDDMRTYMLLKAQGIKANAEDLFPSIRAVKIYDEARQHATRAVPKGLFLEKMLSSVNGDGSSLLWLGGNK